MHLNTFKLRSRHNHILIFPYLSVHLWQATKRQRIYNINMSLSADVPIKLLLGIFILVANARSLPWRCLFTACALRTSAVMPLMVINHNNKSSKTASCGKYTHICVLCSKLQFQFKVLRQRMRCFAKSPGSCTASPSANESTKCCNYVLLQLVTRETRT